MLVRQHGDHDPAPRRLVPERLRIAEVLQAQIEHRVLGVLRPRPAAVVAVGEVLRLLAVSVSRVDGDEARAVGPRCRAKPARVVPVDDDAAREDHHPVGFVQGDRQVLPVQQVGADGVAPAHMAPLLAQRVVLVEQVVLALVEDEPVRVVHEVARWREVELRPQWLVIGRRLCGQECERSGRHRQWARQGMGHGADSWGAACDRTFGTAVLDRA